MKKREKNSARASALQIIAVVGLGCIGAVLLASSLMSQSSAPSSASGKAVAAPAAPVSKGHVIVSKDVKHDVSPPLRDMPAVSFTLQSRNCEVKENPPTKIPHKDAPDGALRELEGPKLALAQPSALATINLNMEGIDFPGVVCSCNPPDTDGAVGLTQYVQEVNEGLQVFNKSTGASEAGPVAVASIWNGFGGVCQNAGEGDVVVLYDHFANRWLISEFAVTGSTVTDECVAVSTSPDATGSYYRYDFVLNPTFGANYYDYPKIGIWEDGYYLSFNVFNSAGTSFLGPQPFAMQSSQMIQGLSAVIESPTSPLGGSIGPILPADIDGMTLPPSGAPETFIGFPASGSYVVYHFHADFNTPSNATWTTFATPAAAGFTELCTAGRSCIPQAGIAVTTSGLDGIGDRFMFRAAYRNFGTQASPNESIVSNFTVCATGANCGNGTTSPYTGTAQSGVRWFQLLNVTNGPVTVNQDSTYNNGGADTLWRWMGSIAQDNAGDMLLGFSTSAGTTGTVFPAIHYTGRLSTDPLNSMAQGEATIFSGAGVQSTSGNRWGDYSAMSVDPEDDCTFWYTQEYYPSGTNTFDWRTRIAKFVPFSQCTPISAQPQAAVSLYDVADNASINPGANLGYTVTVNSSGTATALGLSFSDPLPSGNGINWSISSQDASNFSISGSPPNQALVFSPTSMAAGTSSFAHVVSSTTSADCGSTYTNAPMLSSTNGGIGIANPLTPAATTVMDCTNCTPNAFTDSTPGGSGPQLADPDSILDQAVAAIGAKFYQFPGIAGGAFGTTARVYDSNANTWSTIAALSAANERESAVAVSDGTQYIYILNGLNSAGTAQSTNIEYDSTGNTYSTGAVTGLASWAAGAAYFNGKIYLMGGLNSAGSAANTTLRIGTITAGTPPTVAWAAGAAVPVGVAWPQVTHINVGGTDYIYLAGGTTASTPSSAVYRYNIGTNTWSANLGNMPATIFSAANGVVNGYWVLAGGFVNGAASNAVYSYLASSNTWTLNASSMVQPRARGAGATTPTSLYSIGGMTPAGGFGGSTDNQAYTPSLCAPGLVSVVSRQVHGSNGTFDLPLSTTPCSVSGNPFPGTIEPRQGNTAGGVATPGPGNFQIVFNYAVPVTSSGTQSFTGSGSAAPPTFSGNSMSVNLSSVSDMQIATLSVPNVTGPGSGTSSNSIQVGFLIGDVNGDGFVNVGDVIMVRTNAGSTLGSSNFQFDLNTDGFINVGDTIIVRTNSGNGLPNCP